MPEFSDERDPVECLADEYIQRHRRGERPTIDQYAQDYPQWADEIRALFPTVAVLENMRVRPARRPDGKAELGGSRPETLGDFRILREIGRGGMGIVYEAEQISLGRLVAVKVLPRQVLLDSKQLKRFEREARAAAALHHTNIVPVFGVGEHDGYHFIVMQRIDGVGLDEVMDVLKRIAAGLEPPEGAEVKSLDRAGQSLSAAVALAEGKFFKSTAGGMDSGLPRGHIPGGSTPSSDTFAMSGGDTDAVSSESNASSSGERLSVTAAREAISNGGGSGDASHLSHKKVTLGPKYWRNVARIGVQVADALRYAHGQKMLHRDIKPANLLLDTHGVVWVADFGLAKAADHDDVSRSGDVVGTLRYMAPEQVRGQADERSDLFSLGLTLYEMLALEPAFDDATRRRALVIADNLGEATPLRKIRSDIPRDLETIVMKTIASEPARRYASAEAMAADLLAFLEDRPIQARRTNPAERLLRWSRRNPATAASLAAAAMLLIAVFVVTARAYITTDQAYQQTQAALDGEKEQRDIAEQTLNIALDALDRMYDRFAPDRLIYTSQLTIEDADGQAVSIPVQPSLSHDTTALMKDMLTFYDRFAALDATNVESAERAARAYFRIGEIYQRLGQYPQAESSYMRSLEKYGELSGKAGDEEMQVTIARIHNELGSMYRLLLWEDEADEELLVAMSLLNEIVDQEGASPEARFELARTYYTLGRRAAVEFSPPQPGVPFFGPEFGGPGDDFGRGGQRGGRQERGGGRNRNRGRGGPFDLGPPPDEFGGPGIPPPGTSGRSGRPSYVNEAIEILESLSQEYSTAGEYRRLLALCYLDRTEGLDSEDWDKSIEILEVLAAEFPTVADYQFDLSRAYATSVTGQRSRFENVPTIADFKLGQERLITAIGYTEKLVADHPNEPQYVSAQVLHYWTLGQLYQDEGGFRLFRFHSQLDEQFWQSIPYDQYTAVLQAWDAQRVLTEEAFGQCAAHAEEAFQSAVELQQTLVQKFPETPEHRVDLARARLYLAGLVSSRGDEPGALDLLSAIVAEGSQLLEGSPDSSNVHHLLATSYGMQSSIYYGLDDVDKGDLAFAAFEEHIQVVFPFGYGRGGRDGFGGPRDDWRDDDYRNDGRGGRRGGRGRGGRGGGGRR